MPTPKESLSLIRSRINASLPQGAKPPLLVGVTKGQSQEEILKFYMLGMRDFGENKIQEALLKIEALPKDISWHFIGHLQSNKVKDAVGKFVLIHSIDSLKLLEKINCRAREIGIAQDVLLEVNVSNEKTKIGLKMSEVKGVLENSKGMENIRVLGLMTLAPYGAKETETIFKTLRDLAHSFGLSELSMGMSDDFETAIKEGATIIRIGRALYGEHPIA